MSDRIKSGYRVIGENTYDGTAASWYFPTEEFANKFAEHLVKNNGGIAEVCKLLSVFEVEYPVVQIKSED